MGLANYMLNIRKSNNIGRWSNEFMHRRPNVSEHSFMVIQTGQMLACIEEANGNKVDWASMYRKLTNHDVIEVLTGDILNTVKHKKVEMKDLVNKIEREVAEEELFSHMEEPYRSFYEDILFDGKDQTLEGQILKYADNIDALMECIFEISQYNFYPFESKYYKIVNELKQSELVSVQFFVENILPELTEKCERISKTKES